MDASPSLVEVLDALQQVRLEAILIGGAAAALQGAPITTIDFDFHFRASKQNEKKLVALASLLAAELTQPHPGISSLFRIQRKEPFLQLDLMTNIHGVSSFNSLRSRAIEMEVERRKVLVAGLADIIKSKKEAGRAKDIAGLLVLEETLREIASREIESLEAGNGEASA